MQRPTDRPDRRLVIGVAAVMLFLLGACDGGEDAPAADQPSVATGAPEEPANATAEEIATGFLEAFGAFDVDRATGYLADDAVISALLIGTESVQGAEEELRLNLSMLEAQGYEQRLGSCEETGALVSGTGVRCPFDFHLFGSDEIGLGPYAGSYFDVTVLDGEVVRGSVTYEIEEFSPEMWEPFAEWVSTTYPDDAAVMYEDGSYTGVSISDASIGLWGRHVPEYVEEAQA
jgi:hypothetical protein